MDDVTVTLTLKVKVPMGLYFPNQPEEHDPDDPESVSAELARIVGQAVTDIGASLVYLGASDIYKTTYL